MKRKVGEMSQTIDVEDISSFASEPDVVSSVVEDIQSFDSEPNHVCVADAQDAFSLSQDNLEGKFSDVKPLHAAETETKFLERSQNVKPLPDKSHKKMHEGSSRHRNFLWKFTSHCMLESNWIDFKFRCGPHQNKSSFNLQSR